MQSVACAILRGSGVQRLSHVLPSQVEHYPAPEHRTVALAHQAAELYLALYFVPQVLHKDPALMRTLVDRYVSVVSIGARTSLRRADRPRPCLPKWFRRKGVFGPHAP